MLLGNKIQELRNEKKVSALELGKAVGKSESTIRMWESNNSKPDCDTLIKLAEYFECSADYLLGLSEFKNKEDNESYKIDIKDLSDMLIKLPDESRKTLIISINSMIIGYESFDGTLDADLKDEYLRLLYKTIHSYCALAQDLEDARVFIREKDDDEYTYGLWLFILEHQNGILEATNEYISAIKARFNQCLPKDFKLELNKVSLTREQLREQLKSAEPYKQYVDSKIEHTKDK